MATSVQAADNKSVILNDLDLIAIVLLLDAEVGARPREFSSIRPLVARWKSALANYGPGTIDLGLEQVAANETISSELQKGLAYVRQGIGRAAMVPGPVLNGLCTIRGVRFTDVPSNTIRSAIDKIIDVVAR